MVQWHDNETIAQWNGEGMRDRMSHVDPWCHLDGVEENRRRADIQTIQTQKGLEESFRQKGRPGQDIVKGDLVLLRRFVVDKDKGQKMEPRWEGPYLVEAIRRSAVSAWIKDIHTVKLEGSYSFDA